MIGRALSCVFVWLVIFYQRCISPYLGSSCRFYPTCSQYAVDCFRNCSFGRACLLVVRRLARCHPWGSCGVDLPRCR